MLTSSDLSGRPTAEAHGHKSRAYPSSLGITWSRPSAARIELRSALSILLSLLRKHLVKVVEDFGTAREAFRIVRCRKGDAVDQSSYANSFIAPEFIVLE